MIAAALADPVTTRIVRVRDGAVASTDGPYAEAKEHLVGYYPVECDSLERATAIAAQIPDARYDTLALLFLCCHPCLSAPSQVALTLRAVGGLSTAQIARAFLVPEATMAQRISRAKQQITAAGARFAMSGQDRERRLDAVLHVLYLVFNEGYTTTSGPEPLRAELTSEAIRLAREARRLLPGNGEVAGLLTLMLLTDARRPARTRPFQIQAAIAAVHAEATNAADTDWPQILALYDLLAQTSKNPVVLLNTAVAVEMVHGPRAGLDLLTDLDQDRHMAGHHRLHAVRAHLHEQAGELVAAQAAFEEAARRATSIPEKRYLQAQAARLATSTGP